MKGHGEDASSVQWGPRAFGSLDVLGVNVLDAAGRGPTPGRPSARRPPPRRELGGEALCRGLVALAFTLAGCDVGDPMDDVGEPNHAVTHLAMATDAGDDAASDPGGVGDDRVSSGTYTLDEIKALLTAADPAFAAALASTTTGTPPDGAVPARVERSSDGPCLLQAERPTEAVDPAPYVPPSWDREVDVFERLGAIPDHDLVTLDEVHAGLAEAATYDDGTESPTKSPR